MKLEDYLRLLRECPDEFVILEGKKRLNRLTMEYGIYDNWPIFTNSDYEKIIEDFKKNKKWKHKSSSRQENEKDINNVFYYNPGVMIVQVQNRVPYCDCTHDENGFHKEKQKELFNMGFCLHPYQEKKIEGVSEYRAQIIVINEIADYLRANNFPLCFPRSLGWVNRNSSQVVYWPDELHDEMQRLAREAGAQK